MTLTGQKFWFRELPAFLNFSFRITVLISSLDFGFSYPLSIRVLRVLVRITVLIFSLDFGFHIRFQFGFRFLIPFHLRFRFEF